MTKSNDAAQAAAADAALPINRIFLTGGSGSGAGEASCRLCIKHSDARDMGWRERGKGSGDAICGRP
ncbi:hypothetical protein GV68_20440 [Pseudorhizobium pelagicum]|uniref:Uncharacterized protein n=1 Tax=Pseudorhizobium pelagicum TaxID=1509405 RepID=A0A922NWN6_9HYPH|nr:hypothetical protein GV68_20440 [Pseudorhizobium pelagicum]